MAKQKNNSKTVEQTLYGAGLVIGAVAIYWGVGVKFGMPNPLKKRGLTKQQLQEIKYP